MSRWSRYDSDDYRLPEGMKRVGYDADSQKYTYQDSDGSYWEGPAGAHYGTLRRGNSSCTLISLESTPLTISSVREASPLPSATIDSDSDSDTNSTYVESLPAYQPRHERFTNFDQLDQNTHSSDSDSVDKKSASSPLSRRLSRHYSRRTSRSGHKKSRRGGDGGEVAATGDGRRDIDDHDDDTTEASRRDWQYFAPLLVLVGSILLFTHYMLSGTSFGGVEPDFDAARCGPGTKSGQNSVGETEAAGGSTYAPERWIPYKVREGDTCWNIAERHGMSLENLLDAGGNEGVRCRKLGVGEVVCVKEKAGEEYHRLE